MTKTKWPIAAILLLLWFAPAQVSAASNRLSWTVQDEKDVFGYIVYRSEQRAGPFSRASSSVIRRKPTSDGSATTYSFVDEKLVACTTYYYFIDVIAVSGRKQRLSGVQSRKAEGQ